MTQARTAVNQAPHGGSDYPFISQTDLSAAILDVYVSYESGIYLDDNRCELLAPFRLLLDCTILSASVGLFDANDNRLDSTFSTNDAECTISLWGADRAICEWVRDTIVLRLVFDLNYAVAADGLDAILDSRTVNRLPKRVRSLHVGVVTLNENVVIQAGYNIDMSVPAAILDDGGRAFNQVALDGVPGAGAGRLTGCAEVEPLVRRINRVLPDTGGNFIVEADDCFRAQGSFSMASEGGHRSATYSVAEMDDDNAKSAIKLYDDCRPCCDCDYFVRTYRGLKRMWNLWKDIAADAEAVRDTYNANRDRWLAQRECRMNNPLRLIAMTEPQCRTFVGGSYCNMAKCCLKPFMLRFTFQRYIDGVLTDITPSGADILEAYIDGAPMRQGEEKYAPRVYQFPSSDDDAQLLKWPVVDFHFDYADPQSTSTARLRFCIACAANESLGVTLTAHANDPEPAPGTEEVCVIPTPTVPNAVQSIWDAVSAPADMPVRAILSRVVGFDPAPTQYNCECS